MNLICVGVCLLLLKPFAEFLCGVDIAIWIAKHKSMKEMKEVLDSIRHDDWFAFTKYCDEAASEICKERSKRS